MGDCVASDRYRLMLERMREEYREQHAGSTHGFVRWSARKLKTDESLPKRILDRTRLAGRDVIERAIKEIPLDPDYFLDRKLRDPNYRDYVSAKRSEAEVPRRARGGPVPRELRAVLSNIPVLDSRAVNDLMAQTENAQGWTEQQWRALYDARTEHYRVLDRAGERPSDRVPRRRSS